MSKLTRKCPNCGATMPVDVKYCRKCHAKMDSGRVEVLSESGQEKSRPQKRDKKDALRNLPKPVRPVEEAEPDAVREAEQVPVEQAAEETEAAAAGYAAASQYGIRRERRAPAGSETPRPVSTARGPGAQKAQKQNADRNLWQIITILAIILVIIVVAIVLVIKLNRPADETAAGAPAGESHVIASGTEDPDAGSGEENAPPAATPEGLIVPSATPAATPTPTPVVTPTPTPFVTPTPVPTPTTAPANANSNVTPVNDTVYINGNGVNVRSGPGTNYQILGSENTGKQLQRTGKTTNGWSQVSYNGQTAYVIDTFLTSTAPAANNSTGTANNNNYTVTDASGTVKVTAASGANLRTGPGTGYGIAATVALNTQLTRTGTSGGWTRVSYNGQNVFISSNLVTDDTGTGTTNNTTGTTTGNNTTNGVTAETGTITVTGNGVNIRTGPGTNYSRIGSANSGNVLTVTGKSGNWYQISYNGQTAYISADYARKN